MTPSPDIVPRHKNIQLSQVYHHLITLVLHEEAKLLNKECD